MSVAAQNHHSRWERERKVRWVASRKIDGVYALSTEAPVVVLLLRLGIYLGFRLRRLCLEHMDGILVRGVNVLLLCRHVDLDFVAFFRSLHDTKVSVDLIVALRTP